MKWFIRKRKPVAPPRALQRTVKMMPVKEPDEIPEEALPYYCYPHTVQRSQADIDSFNIGTALFNQSSPPTTIRGVLEEMDGDASVAEMIKALEQAKLI